MLIEMLRDLTCTELSIIHSLGLSFPFCKLGSIPTLPIYVMGIEDDNIDDHKREKACCTDKQQTLLPLQTHFYIIANNTSLKSGEDVLSALLLLSSRTPAPRGAWQMINKSSDEYATWFCLNKSCSCWELNKKNKAIEIHDVEKLPAHLTEPPKWGLPATHGSWLFQRCKMCHWWDTPTQSRVPALKAAPFP